MLMFTLNDESQQNGNLDEASAIARIPRKGIVTWSGDHKQTPGGLCKSDEARAFRRTLMCRPIALRGDAKFTKVRHPNPIASSST